MPGYHERAEEVEEIAYALIRQYHPHLTRMHLHNRIEYRFLCDDLPKSDGKFRYGRAVRITGLHKSLAGRNLDFFCIEITQILWNKLREDQKIALVDHELMHCFVDKDEKLSILPHDFTGFNKEVQRYGAWHDDLQELAATIAAKLGLNADQLGLAFDAPETEAEEGEEEDEQIPFPDDAMKEIVTGVSVTTADGETTEFGSDMEGAIRSVLVGQGHSLRMAAGGAG